MPKPRSSTVAVVATGVLLAACTGGHEVSDDVAPTSQPGTFTRVGMDASRQAPAPEIEGAVSGGRLTVRTGFGLVPTCLHPGCDTPALDPSANYYIDSVAISSGLLTRSLTQYVWDPESDGLILVPDLATDLGRPNADYTEWTFVIRDGVRFEDGTPVTAADVAYGIKRSMDGTKFPGGPAWGNEYFLHGDTYQGLYTGGSDYDGVVVDGQTLTIKMARPFPDMPYYGAFPEMGPIPVAGSDPATYGRHPLATGPYKVEEFVPKKSLTLVRNPEWDPDTDPGRHQYVDEYDFLFSQHMRLVWPDLIADRPQTQTTLSYDDVPPAWIAEARRRARDRLIERPTQCISGAWPDYGNIDDLQVRQALGYAWPYRQYRRNLQRQAGTPVAIAPFASSIMPPGTAGRLDYSPLSTRLGETDPAKSRALLAEAGHDPGEYRIDFLYPAGTSTGGVVALALEHGGFHVVLHPVGPVRYNRIRFDPGAPVNLRLGGLCADWPSGEAWLPLMFTNPAAGFDLGFFHEDAVDAEVDRIERLPLDQQDAAWGRLDQMIQETFYPFIPGFYSGTAQLHGSRIGGLHIDRFTGMPTFKDLYLIPAKD